MLSCGITGASGVLGKRLKVYLPYNFKVFDNSFVFAKNWETIWPLIRPAAPPFINPILSWTMATTIDFIMIAFAGSLISLMVQLKKIQEKEKNE